MDNTLTNEAVQNSTFGLKQVFKVDGQVYAQPLYAPSVYVNGQPRNLLVIATMNSSIYVYDAGLDLQDLFCLCVFPSIWTMLRHDLATTRTFFFKRLMLYANAPCAVQTHKRLSGRGTM